jgi:hypothetical protein
MRTPQSSRPDKGNDQVDNRQVSISHIAKVSEAAEDEMRRREANSEDKRYGPWEGAACRKNFYNFARHAGGTNQEDSRRRDILCFQWETVSVMDALDLKSCVRRVPNLPPISSGLLGKHAKNRAGAN